MGLLPSFLFEVPFDDSLRFRPGSRALVAGPPEQFGALIRSEIETYTKLVKAAGIKAD